MKILLLLATVMGLAYSAPMTGELISDLKDFLVILPIKQIRETFNKHLESDPEFQSAIKYIRSKEYGKMVKSFHLKPSVKEFRMVIKDAGLDLEFFENMISIYIESLIINVEDDQKRSFGKFLKEIDELIPYDELLDLLAEKLENSSVFKKFFNTITDEKMHKLADKIVSSEDFRRIAKEFIAMDVYVYEILEAVYAVFGWKDTESVINDLPY